MGSQTLYVPEIQISQFVLWIIEQTQLQDLQLFTYEDEVVAL